MSTCVALDNIKAAVRDTLRNTNSHIRPEQEQELIDKLYEHYATLRNADTELFLNYIFKCDLVVAQFARDLAPELNIPVQSDDEADKVLSEETLQIVHVIRSILLGANETASTLAILLSIDVLSERYHSLNPKSSETFASFLYKDVYNTRVTVLRIQNCLNTKQDYTRGVV